MKMKNLQTSLTSARYEFLTAEDLNLSTSALAVISALFDEEIGYPAPAALYRAADDIPWKGAPIAPPPEPRASSQDLHVVLCVGHSRAGDSGAVAVDGKSEHAFYDEDIVDDVAESLGAFGYRVTVIREYEGSSYGKAMRWLAEKLLEIGADLAFELHFNASSNHGATGFEALYWHKSTRSAEVAEAMQSTQAAFYPARKNRGVEPLGDQAHERGVLFCSLPHCSSIILEPFFGTSLTEVRVYMSDEGRPLFVKMLAEGIHAGALTLL
tara:strand:+ start:19170 stop:19973 length:804 start_codon:yes stop_codon:yes gene_type:complete